MRVHTRQLPGPVAVLDQRPPALWATRDTVLAGHGEALRIAAGVGHQRFSTAENAFREWIDSVSVTDEVGLPGTGPVGFSSFTFDERSHGSVLVVPEVLVGRQGETWFMTTVGDVDPTPLLASTPIEEEATDRLRYAGASIPDVAWLEAVAAAGDEIAAGRIEKVVLARDHAVWSKERFDTRRLLDKLITGFPGCFVFLVDGLIGASPELLVRRMGRAVESVSLAGSARRSPDPVEDRRVADELLSSDKDRREHEAVAASVGEVLGKVCEQLERDPTPVLMDLANVRHLATRFRGRLRRLATVLELGSLLHPTPAVGGTPTGAALEAIRRLESMDRGRYAGPVGWMDRHGDGELAIALRCAEISGARARLFAGAGIVEGSLPESELEETRLKLQAMLSALS